MSKHQDRKKFWIKRNCSHYKGYWTKKKERKKWWRCSSHLWKITRLSTVALEISAQPNRVRANEPPHHSTLCGTRGSQTYSFFVNFVAVQQTFASHFFALLEEQALVNKIENFNTNFFLKKIKKKKNKKENEQKLQKKKITWKYDMKRLDWFRAEKINVEYCLAVCFRHCKKKK